MPPGTTAVRFAADPSGVPIEIYNSSGALVPNQPTSVGNKVYEISNVTSGVWAMNLKGAYWSDVRFLNTYQIVSFRPELLMAPAPN